MVIKDVYLALSSIHQISTNCKNWLGMEITASALKLIHIVKSYNI